MDLEKEVISIGDSNYFYFGMGQVGFSLHVTPDTGDLVFGAPGILHWTGSTLLLNERSQANPYDALLVDVADFEHLGYSDLFGKFQMYGYT